MLGAAKAEFRKYGDVWDKLGKQLAAAQNTVSDAGKRTRAVERKLREVETVETIDASADLLALSGSEEEDEAGVRPAFHFLSRVQPCVRPARGVSNLGTLRVPTPIVRPSRGGRVRRSFKRSAP